MVPILEKFYSYSHENGPVQFASNFVAPDSYTGVSEDPYIEQQSLPFNLNDS